MWSSRTASTRARMACSCVLAIALLACAAPSGMEDQQHPRKEAAVQHRPKTGAPVAIDGVAGDAAAELAIAFSAPADNVRVELWGVDGLKLASPATPVDGAHVESGEVLSLRVAYVRPSGEAHLAIRVRGRFGGRELVRVGSLTVGVVVPKSQGPARALDASGAGGAKDVVVIDGRPVRLMPAD